MKRPSQYCTNILKRFNLVCNSTEQWHVFATEHNAAVNSDVAELSHQSLGINITKALLI